MGHGPLLIDLFGEIELRYVELRYHGAAAMHDPTWEVFA
jgi:hypothetical protein